MLFRSHHIAHLFDVEILEQGVDLVGPIKAFWRGFRRGGLAKLGWRHEQESAVGGCDVGTSVPPQAGLARRVLAARGV